MGPIKRLRNYDTCTYAEEVLELFQFFPMFTTMAIGSIPIFFLFLDLWLTYPKLKDQKYNIMIKNVELVSWAQ